MTMTEFKWFTLLSKRTCTNEDYICTDCNNFPLCGLTQSRTSVSSSAGHWVACCVSASLSDFLGIASS